MKKTKQTNLWFDIDLLKQWLNFVANNMTLYADELPSKHINELLNYSLLQIHRHIQS